MDEENSERRGVPGPGAYQAGQRPGRTARSARAPAAARARARARRLNRARPPCAAAAATPPAQGWSPGPRAGRAWPAPPLPNEARARPPSRRPRGQARPRWRSSAARTAAAHATFDVFLQSSLNLHASEQCTAAQPMHAASKALMQLLQSLLTQGQYCRPTARSLLLRRGLTRGGARGGTTGLQLFAPCWPGCQWSLLLHRGLARGSPKRGRLQKKCSASHHAGQAVGRAAAHELEAARVQLRTRVHAAVLGLGGGAPLEAQRRPRCASAGALQRRGGLHPPQLTNLSFLSSLLFSPVVELLIIMMLLSIVICLIFP
jgi:hypothetical protein